MPGVARGADPAAVKDQDVPRENPLRLREEGHEVALDLLGVFLVGQAHAPGEPQDVRVHHDARGLAVGDAQNDVGRLTGDAAKREKVLHRVGDLAGVRLAYPSARLADGPGLVPEEAEAVNVLLQLLLRDLPKCLGGPVLLEEARGHGVDHLVRTLGREDRGDKQLQRHLVHKRALGVRVCLMQPADDLAGAFLPLLEGF